MKVTKICKVCGISFKTDKRGYYKKYIAQTGYTDITKNKCRACETLCLNKIFTKTTV